jgi:hypothetical protein
MNIDHILIGTNPETRKQDVFMPEGVRGYSSVKFQDFNIVFAHEYLIRWHKERQLPLVRYGQEKSEYEVPRKEQPSLPGLGE